MTTQTKKLLDEKALRAAIEHCDALTADDCIGVITAYEAHRTTNLSAGDAANEVSLKNGSKIKLIETGEKLAGQPNLSAEGDYSNVTVKWKELKPSLEAQKIRSALLHELDSTDSMPDYLVDVVDIAVQLGINLTKQEPKSNLSADEKKLMDFIMDVTLGYNPKMVQARLADAISKHFPANQPNLSALNSDEAVSIKNVVARMGYTGSIECSDAEIARNVLDAAGVKYVD